jgi:hypothetical protein
MPMCYTFIILFEALPRDLILQYTKDGSDPLMSVKISSMTTVKPNNKYSPFSTITPVLKLIKITKFIISDAHMSQLFDLLMHKKSICKE